MPSHACSLDDPANGCATCQPGIDGDPTACATCTVSGYVVDKDDHSRQYGQVTWGVRPTEHGAPGIKSTLRVARL